MVTHMKTTIKVSDALFEEAKAMARARGITLRELIEAGLLAVVDKAHHREPVTYRRHTVNGNGLQPGVREGNWEEIRSLAYGGRGG